jgi:DHA2 family multidrug resistance protein-like MFS transporter
LAVLALACVLYAMDLTVLHLAVPKLSAALEPSSAQLLWIIDIYGFFVAGSLITMGTLGDRIGRRRLLMIGASLFGVTSVIAALSTSAEMLIAARALMGIAGATLAPSTLSLIFNMFRDPGQRARAIGVWISAFSTGSAIGPVAGGILLEYFWWGSVFLLALPVMALLLTLGPRVLPEYRDMKAGKLDILSAAMSLAAFLAAIFGIKQIAQDGISTLALGAIALGLAIGYLFVRRQRGLRDPLIDLRLFRLGAFNTALATNVLSIFIAVGYFLYIPQYMQLVLGLSPLVAGLWTLPSAAAFIISSNVAPFYIHRFKPSLLLASHLAVAAFAILALTLVNQANGLFIVVAASIFVGMALSPVLSLTTELIIGSAPQNKAGAASGISETGAEFGGALGIAILGSIGTAVYRGQLATRLPVGIPVEIAEIARDTLGAALDVAQQLPAAARADLLEQASAAFVSGFHLTAGIAGAIAIVAATIAAVAMRKVPARGKYASHGGH